MNFICTVVYIHCFFNISLPPKKFLRLYIHYIIYMCVYIKLCPIIDWTKIPEQNLYFLIYFFSLSCTYKTVLFCFCVAFIFLFKYNLLLTCRVKFYLDQIVWIWAKLYFIVVFWFSSRKNSFLVGILWRERKKQSKIFPHVL